MDSSPYYIINHLYSYRFNGQDDGSSDELVQVVVARELPEVLPYVVHIECLQVLLQCRLELSAKLLVGEGLVPQVLDLVVQGLQGEHVQHLLQDLFFIEGITVLNKGLILIRLHQKLRHQICI